MIKEITILHVLLVQNYSPAFGVTWVQPIYPFSPVVINPTSPELWSKAHQRYEVFLYSLTIASSVLP